MSREMLSKRAFENWYFEYCEAEREFSEAKRCFELKKRDICLFLFSAYSEWCKLRFGLVLKPQDSVDRSHRETAADLFCADCRIDPVFRVIATQMLSRVFHEREQQMC